MRTQWFRHAAALTVIGLAGAASADTPLQLEYAVSDAGGGMWQYDFTLLNLNLDGSWLPGQNFDWITFGDVNGGTSTLDDFIGDIGSLVGSPWETDGFSYSSGGHNGPTLLDLDGGFVGWVPSSVGDSVSWSGTSSHYLGQGELLWSSLIAGGGNGGNFDVAILVPAPASGLMLGLAGLVCSRRRR